MRKQLFNDGWRFAYQSINGEKASTAPQDICLPHDAVISLPQAEKMAGGMNKGYYPDCSVIYTKKLMVNAEDEGKTLLLRFDGVYANATVYVNGTVARQWSEGYTGFYVEIQNYVRYGEYNEITVEAFSAEDSRWYTGAGIYRNVYLYRLEKTHFVPGSIHIRTLEADSELAVLEVSMTLRNRDTVKHMVEAHTSLTDSSARLLVSDCRRITLGGLSEETVTFRVYGKAPRLWDTVDPELYEASFRLMEDDLLRDEDSFRYGIRTLKLDNVHGLRLNGQRIVLNGGCVHHSHGIIGSADFREAEYLRIRRMKDAGYNAVRSSHNHCSELMLEACDYYGMLVMDELTDVWQCSKTKDDISKQFERLWPEILQSMIEDDRNHACVIMYSIGNEIKEVAADSGRRLARKIANHIRLQDPDRFITSGINGLLCLMGGEAVPDAAQNEEEINAMMAQLLTMMSAIQCSEQVVEGTRELSESLDVVGYNYAEDKQLLDMARFTNRVCVGSETFPRSIAKNWAMAKENPAILGDFVWTGWDYLGEAGIGENGLVGNGQKLGMYQGYPYRTANCGDFDIAGHRRPQSYYREIVTGHRDEPYIVVENPARYGQPRPTSPWSWTDGESTWSLGNSEGRPVQVEVYGKGDEAELFVNGASVGRKQIPSTSGEQSLAFCTEFDAVYHAGVIKAVLYRDGRETARTQIVTASENLQITANVDTGSPGLGTNDLRFCELALTDENGIVSSFQDREISIEVEGGSIQGFGSANPVCGENFTFGKAHTYYGRALLAVRPTGEGKMVVRAYADNCRPLTISM